MAPKVGSPALKFTVGDSLTDFEDYYSTAGLPWGKLGNVERSHIVSNPDHLILFEDKGKIIGHAIWHESNSEEHTPGGRPREADDRRTLRRLVGRRKGFIELHELWVTPGRRGRGCGMKFLDFFERFAADRGFTHIVHHAFDPAALALCRKRGYREEFGVKSDMTPVLYVFCLDL